MDLIKNAKPISLNTDNVLGYMIGASLISAPYLLRFSDLKPARNLFLSLGIGLIGYSLVKKIPMDLHRKTNDQDPDVVASPEVKNVLQEHFAADFKEASA